MAILINTTSGTFSTLAWNVIDSNTFTDNKTNFQTTTTTFIGAGFTAASGLTVSSIGFNFVGRNNPVSNVIVQVITGNIITATAATILASMSCNVTSLPNYSINAGWLGWLFFDLNSVANLTSGLTYSVRIRTDAAQVRFYSAATTGNINIALVTSQTASPTSSDTLFVCGSIDSSSIISKTITMDNIGTQSYGPLYISCYGTLKYPRTAPTPTEYTLRMAGNGWIGVESFLDMGTTASGDSIDSNITAVFEFAPTVNNQYGLTCIGTIYTAGSFKTPGVTLNGTAFAGATSFSVSSAPTGWSNNDLIYLTGTTLRTISGGSVTNFFDDEVRIASVSGTTINTITALGNTHSGNATTYVQGHVVNLTRNVKIRIWTNRPTLRGSITNPNINNPCYFYNTEIVSLPILMSVTDIIFDGSTLYTIEGFTFSAGAILGVNTINGIISGSNTNINNSIFYKIGTSGSAAIQSKISNYNYIVKIIAGFFAVRSSRAIGSYNVFSNLSTGAVWNDFEDGATDNIFYNMNGVAIAIVATSTKQFYNFKIWRCNNTIALFENSTSSNYRRTMIQVFNNFRCFGILGTLFTTLNPTTGGAISFGMHRIVFRDSYFYNGTTFLDTSTLSFNPNSVTTPTYFFEYMHFLNCVIGRDDLGNQSGATFSTIIRGHNSNNIIFTDCIFGTSSTEYGIPLYLTTALRQESIYTLPGIVSNNHNQVPGSYRSYQTMGVASNDTVYQGMRLTPFVANGRVFSNTVRIPIRPEDGLCTITTSIRRSSTSDSNRYNGSPVRLMMVSNPLASGTASVNYITDTICATSSSALSTGAWETLSYTLPAPVSSNCILEFYVDCDCTTFPGGFVTVKDWRALGLYNKVINNDTRNNNFSSSEGQFVFPSYFTDSTAFAFISSETTPIEYDVDYQAVLNYAITQEWSIPSYNTRLKDNNLILSLKAAGIWNKLDIFYMFSTDGDSNFATINWKSPGNYTVSLLGNTLPSFTTNSGFTGNSAQLSYIDTNWTPNMGVNYTLDNASRHIWKGNSITNGPLDGNSNNTNTIYTTSSTIHRINSTTSLSSLFNYLTNIGMKSIHRTSNIDVYLGINATLTTRTATSTALSTNNQWLLRSGSSQYSGHLIRMYSTGASLVSENTDYYNAINTRLS